MEEAMMNIGALDAMRAQFQNHAAFHAAGAQVQEAQLLPQLPTIPPPLPSFPGVPGALTAPTGPAGGQEVAGAGNALVALLQPPPALNAVPLMRPPAALDASLSHAALASIGKPQVSMQDLQQQQREQQDRDRAIAAQEAAARAHKHKEEKAKLREQAEKLKCHLHSKAKNSCKFCKRYQEAVAKAEKDEVDASQAGGGLKGVPGSYEEIRSMQGLIEVTNAKHYGFSPLLQSHIVESKHYKELMNLLTFDQLVKEMYQYADTVDPYMQNTVGSTMPSGAFCCLYRLFTMGIDMQQLRRLVEIDDSPYIRCIGFLFIRFGLPPEHLWPWLSEFVLDTEEFATSKGSDLYTTIGEFVEGLLMEDKYYATVLPRLPMSLKRQIEAKLAPMPQYRKRTSANFALLEVYRREGVRVEVNPTGEWLAGNVLELLESAPSRIKAVVRLRDGREEVVPLGKMILTDDRQSVTSGSRRGRDRSRSRSLDWAREKGRSDNELIDEMRNRDRERAVCTSGKDYARKPIGFKKACALPREQGQASYRLMEEETFVSDRAMRRRGPSPERAQQQEIRKAPSAEHQARMEEVFRKYGMAKAQTSSSHNDIDESTVLRFG